MIAHPALMNVAATMPARNIDWFLRWVHSATAMPDLTAHKRSDDVR
jgi:hypothetical protein